MNKVRMCLKNHWRLFLGYGIIFIIISMFALISYRDVIRHVSLMPKSEIIVKNEAYEVGTTEEIPLLEGTKVEQKLFMVSNEWSGFSLCMSGEAGNMEGYLDIRLKDEKGREIQKWIFDTEEFAGEGFHAFFLEKPLKVEVGDVYIVEVESHSTGVVPITFQTNREKKASTYYVNVDGKEQDYILSYEIFNGGNGALKFFYFAVFAGIICCLGLSCLLLMFHVRKEVLFAVMAFIIGGIYMFMIPPYAAPDEAAHYVTVYAESSMLLNRPAVDEKGMVLMDADAAVFLTSDKCPSKSTYVKYFRGILNRDADVDLAQVPTRTALNMKNLGYIPQVLGVTLARILGANAVQVLFAGRIFAILWYCFMMYWSIRLIPEWGKNILFVIGLLPMTMQLTASYNYDSVLMGACFFLISYILYLAYDENKKKVEVKDYLLLLAALAVIMPLKFVYLPLLGLGLLIPEEKFGGMKRKIGAAAFLCIVAVGFLMVTRLDVLVNSVTAAAEAREGVTTYTLQKCLSEPAKTAAVFVRTIENNASFYMETMIGAPLGWLEIPVPNIVITGFALLLFMSFIQMHSEKHKWKAAERVWMALLVLVSGFLICFALLIDWTSESAAVIDGVQGRYFLPLLPALLLAFQNQILVMKRSMDKVIVTGINVLQALTILQVVVFVARR